MYDILNLLIVYPFKVTRKFKESSNERVTRRRTDSSLFESGIIQKSFASELINYLFILSIRKHKAEGSFFKTKKYS
jgi:hypothetical protein